MNNYDDRYEIRIANKNDIEDIMSFIETNWKPGHILAKNREFFEYEFMEEDGSVNFILAIEKKKRTIESLNGFLKASHDNEHMDIWGSIWKVKEGNKCLLGTEIISRRYDLIGCRCDLGVGDNPNTTFPVFKLLLHRFTGKMNHYYMLSDISEFKIARIANRPKRKTGKQNYKVIQFHAIEKLEKRFNFSKFIETRPYKDSWYINHRYFQHPIYKYDVYGIENEVGEVDALIVLRNQEYAGRIAIRFVDLIGNQSLVAGTGNFFCELLKKNNVEYIDFYCAGIDDNCVEEAGFTLRTDEDKNIIPNYFSPFCQQNIEIFVDSAYEKSVFTKADGDQDRPN